MEQSMTQSYMQYRHAMVRADRSANITKGTGTQYNEAGTNKFPFSPADSALWNVVSKYAAFKSDCNASWVIRTESDCLALLLAMEYSMQ